MIVKYAKDRLTLVAETDFEEEVLKEFSSSSLKTWLKHGMSLADTVGLVIEPIER